MRREEEELEDDEEAPAASPEQRRVSIDCSTAVTSAAMAVWPAASKGAVGEVVSMGVKTNFAKLSGLSKTGVKSV